MNKIALCIIILFFTQFSHANNDYDLWLQYNYIENNDLRAEYSNLLAGILSFGDSKTIKVAFDESKRGLSGLLGSKLLLQGNKDGENLLILGSNENLPQDIKGALGAVYNKINNEGYVIKSIYLKNQNHIVITGNTDIGVLYGVFAFLRERGYAGFSIWNWHKLPEYLDQRYIDYARANASVGINGTVLTNVNANAWILTPQYLEKVKALADTFRPYGIKVYLTARFSAPIEIGELETADPYDPNVIQWWKDKTKEIYDEIPDFGGYLVKANSEGQPGPNEYGRNHVDGANMLATALEPFGGIVMWRAFVYSEHDPTDRAKQAYSEFVPHDGQFKDNVLIQVKNGAIDFQPREPFHPMFGAMPKTPLMMEFQITQEYLGFSTHLVFLPKLFQEVLEADTYRKGKGSTVAKVIDGTLDAYRITGVAGVSNIGTDDNWTGHPFLQANWYGFGRLAWNPYMDSRDIADEWIRMTFSNDEDFIEPIKEMMITSREAVVNYMTPLGLHHIMDTGHHYGPGPWVSNLSRPEWNPVYYHKADSLGVGFNRTNTGSNATGQYAPEVAKMYNNIESTPEKDLLWFHHVNWDYKLKNGHTLWDGMALKYQEGVDQVSEMISIWNSLEKYVDPFRFKEVQMSLSIQHKEAKWWRDACLLYFQQFSGKDLPEGVEKPTKTLNYFQSLKFPYAPGIRPRW
ncbi:MAG: alpha-glucuronidase family glycosyl hydrolase [Flavobacteriaceae bacterium]